MAIKYSVIVTGTDPDSKKGGIGVVLPGYFSALELASVPYICISTYRPGSTRGKWLPWIQAFPKIFSSIRKIKKEGLQPIVYSHVGDGLSFFRETCVLWFGKVTGAKTVLQVHSPKVDGYLRHPVKKFFLVIALLPVDRVCVLTDWWKQRLVNSGINTLIHVIPNPLPVDMLKEASKPLSNKHKDNIESPINILSMARLVSGKGFDILVEAMKALPVHFNLVIAGDGNQRHSLEMLAKERGVANRINFAGWVSGSDKVKLLNDADIFCLPSTYDAFPMSMVEAMAYGLPVVAVRWGGIPDMVSDGYSGFLTRRTDPDEIAEAIMLLQDIETRQLMGRQAKTWVLDISSPEFVAQQLIMLFDGVSI